MNDVLLSICIPTYNRSAYLKKSIESIISQKPFIDKLVEIVISDNSSTDDTQDVVHGCTEKHDNIYYYKNIENVRDRNYPLSLSRAHGKLRKLSNDTLIYNKGALEYICSIVEKYDGCRPTIFLANGTLRGISGKASIYELPKALRKISYNVTYIGSFCVWDSDCEDIENDFDGCDLLLWQTSKFLKMASKNSIFIDNNQLFNVQPVEKKNISYGLFKIFHDNYLTIVSRYVASGTLSDRDYAFLEKDVIYRFLTNWAVEEELKSKEFKFSQEENLKDILFKFCKTKSYSINFMAHYFIKYYLRRIKRSIANKIK